MGHVVQVNVSDAKTRLSQLLDQALAGEDVIIARDGKPVVALVPVRRRPPQRQPGAWKGKGWIGVDVDTPDEITESFYSSRIEPE